ncbi:protein transport protein SEC31 [Drosophila serrata]|uniref:protein transport protein SEC31 n=1 Tax=Drosophila serrata TaxID=7274 RepID=UPI000A1D112B|nr:protein transport protein SEC31 [Drosophila serrata]
METHPQARRMQLIWICLSIWLAAGATVSGKPENAVSQEPRHRSKRTMTTICVEIRPSGPQDEPYYMCRGANFAAESGQQGCVEVKNQGGGQEPVYMCQGMEPGKSLPGDGSHHAPKNDQPVTQPGSVHTFPSFPAFGGGSTQQHPQFPENSFHQFPTPPASPSPPSPYQEQSSYPQPLPQQSQPPAFGTSGFHGPPLAAHTSAPAAHSYGLPSVPYPTLGSPSAFPQGAPNGPSPAATAPSYDPTADQGQANRPSKEYGIVGSSRHRFGFDDDVLGVPDVGFRSEELNQQYRRPVNQPQDQMMWVPITHPSEPENDPVMRAFYSSLTGAGSQSQEATVPADIQRESVLGQAPPNYTPYNSQSPGLAPPPTAPYETPNSTPNCNGCLAPSSPVQCQTPADNRMSYSTSCPSFQPVIIAMPCYGQQQPTPYYSVPRNAPGILQRPPPTLAPPFGLSPAPVAGPFGGAFGNGGQMGGSPFGMSQGYGMDQQVGGPFGMGMQLGMGLNPFGPFGTLNPFNPFNRILGAPAQAQPAPNGNFFQRVFNFNPNEYAFPTTEAAPAVETSTTERSGKLNFASSTPTSPTPPISSTPSSISTPSNTEKSPSDILGDALEEEVGEDDSLEPEDLDADLLATTAPEVLDKKQQAEVTAGQLVSKATDLLKPEKRKRQHSRSSRRASQKHRYLQQL